MRIKIIQKYKNPGYAYVMTIISAKERVEELLNSIINKSYSRRYSALSREEILLESSIQDEIDFYELEIHNAETQTPSVSDSEEE
jgi:hypothetical protein